MFWLVLITTFFPSVVLSQELSAEKRIELYMEEGRKKIKSNELSAACDYFSTATKLAEKEGLFKGQQGEMRNFSDKICMEANRKRKEEAERNYICESFGIAIRQCANAGNIEKCAEIRSGFSASRVFEVCK